MFLPSGFRLFVACMVSMHLLSAVAADSIFLNLDPNYAKGRMYDLKFTYQSEIDTQVLMDDKEMKREKIERSYELTSVLMVRELYANGNLYEFDLAISTFNVTKGGETKTIIPERSMVRVRLMEDGKMTLWLDGKSLKDPVAQEALIDFVDNTRMIRVSLDDTIGQGTRTKVGETWEPTLAHTQTFLGTDAQAFAGKLAKAQRVVVLKGVEDDEKIKRSQVQVTVAADISGAGTPELPINKGATKLQFEFRQPVTGAEGLRVEKSLSQVVMKSVLPASAEMPLVTTTNVKVKAMSETRMALRDDMAPAAAPVAGPKPAGPASKPATKEEAGGGGGEVPDGWQ